MSLATVSIVGNLVRQPEQMCFASGQKKTTLVVAVNGPKNHKTEEAPADFYKVESWGKLGELALEYLAKGNQITVCGRLTFDHWTDKLGRQRTTPVIQANQVAFPQRSRNAQNVEPIGGTISGDIDLTEMENSFHAASYLDGTDISNETAVSEKSAPMRPPIRRKASA